MNSVDLRNIHRTVIGNLLKGREMATKLQNLIDEPDVDLQDLALQIFRSFTDSLSVMNALADSTPIAATETSRSRNQNQKLPVKTRRGCYKRRRSSDSWVKFSEIEEDGHAWRKYGQKDILNSAFPRCYYRCTHKAQGCRALKQVQKIKEGPVLYQTTYFNRHTCTPPHPKTPLLSVVEQSTTRFISFQSESDDQTILTVNHSSPLSLKEEEEEDEESGDANSSLSSVALEEMAWPEIINWEGGGSCGSCSFDGLGGMEINGDEFLDIETFQFDDDHIL